MGIVKTEGRNENRGRDGSIIGEDSGNIQQSNNCVDLYIKFTTLSYSLLSKLIAAWHDDLKPVLYETRI